jgi:hypothetical protein
MSIAHNIISTKFSAEIVGIMHIEICTCSKEIISEFYFSEIFTIYTFDQFHNTPNGGELPRRGKGLMVTPLVDEGCLTSSINHYRIIISQ